MHLQNYNLVEKLLGWMLNFASFIIRRTKEEYKNIVFFSGQA